MDTVLIEDLARIVQRKKNTLNRVVNANLMKLFWEIGHEINKFSLKNQLDQVQQKALVRIISESLTVEYGRYFVRKNLDNMRRLATIYSDFVKFQEISLFLSWQHFLILIKIENDQEREFYLNLKIADGLAPAELEREIASARFDVYTSNTPRYGLISSSLTVKRDSKKKQKNINVLLEKNDSSIPILFNKSSTSSFWRLINEEKEMQPNAVNFALQKAIHELAKSYRYKQNEWLNANFNLLLWDFGQRLSQEVGKQQQQRTVDYLLYHVESYFKENKKLFTYDQQRVMLRFVACFPTLEKASQISCLLSWDQIAFLCQQTQRKVFDSYLKTFISRGVGPKTVKKLNSTGNIENSAAQIFESKDLNSTVIISSRKTETMKTKCISTTIKSIELQLNNSHRIRLRIYENRFFHSLFTNSLFLYLFIFSAHCLHCWRLL